MAFSALLLDGFIEAVEVAQELVAVEGALGEFGDDLFDFGRDHVAAGEIRIVEYLAEDALGEQMLHQHALDGFFREIGIDGLPAKGVEVVEAADECRIPAAFFIDSFLDGGGQLRNALREIRDRLLPLLNVGSLVVEELIDDLDEGFGAGDVFVEDARAALIENGAFGGLKDDVVARIALVELELDFLGEVVLFVFGFPIAVRQVVEVDQCSVDDDGRTTGSLDPVFGDERQLAALPCVRTWPATPETRCGRLPRDRCGAGRTGEASRSRPSPWRASA